MNANTFIECNISFSCCSNPHCFTRSSDKQWLRTPAQSLASLRKGLHITSCTEFMGLTSRLEVLWPEGWWHWDKGEKARGSSSWSLGPSPLALTFTGEGEAMQSSSWHRSEGTATAPQVTSCLRGMSSLTGGQAVNAVSRGEREQDKAEGVMYLCPTEMKEKLMCKLMNCLCGLHPTGSLKL